MESFLFCRMQHALLGLPEPKRKSCEVCGRPTDFCVCPMCDVCDEIGNPECYKHHGLVLSHEQIEWRKRSTEENISEKGKEKEKSMDQKDQQGKEETEMTRGKRSKQVRFSPEENKIIEGLVDEGKEISYKKLRAALFTVSGVMRSVPTLTAKVSFMRKKKGVKATRSYFGRSPEPSTPRSLSDILLDAASAVSKMEAKISVLEEDNARYKRFFDSMKKIRTAVEDFQEKHLKDKI